PCPSCVLSVCRSGKWHRAGGGLTRFRANSFSSAACVCAEIHAGDPSVEHSQLFVRQDSCVLFGPNFTAYSTFDERAAMHQALKTGRTGWRYHRVIDRIRRLGREGRAKSKNRR
ncbi:unnamed protein product, partial [Ectocarpus sp. 12 AP-2014]